MAFLIVVVCCILGMIVGGIVGNDATVGFGFFAGIAFGIVFARLRTLSARIEALKRDVAGTTAARAAAFVATERRAEPAQPTPAAPVAPSVTEPAMRTTPPAPPWTRTRLPALTAARSTSPSHAVMATNGREAASRIDSVDGFRASMESCAAELAPLCGWRLADARRRPFRTVRAP